MAPDGYFWTSAHFVEPFLIRLGMYSFLALVVLLFELFSSKVLSTWAFFHCSGALVSACQALIWLWFIISRRCIAIVWCPWRLQYLYAMYWCSHSLVWWVWCCLGCILRYCRYTRLSSSADVLVRLVLGIAVTLVLGKENMLVSALFPCRWFIISFVPTIYLGSLSIRLWFPWVSIRCLWGWSCALQYLIASRPFRRLYWWKVCGLPLSSFWLRRSTCQISTLVWMA